jgi:hypothetical protein
LSVSAIVPSKVDALPEGAAPVEVPDTEAWRRLDERLDKLQHLRG